MRKPWRLLRSSGLTRPIVSWGLFDFANTIFTVNVLQLYFNLWVVEDHGARDVVYTAAFSSSMLAVALVSPILGAVSDRFGRRVPFLLAFTLISVASTALIGRIGGLPVALVLFAAANFAYQAGNVYYDALLSTVSGQGNRGKVSAFGASLGYAGNILGVLMVAPFVTAGGRGEAFLPAALLFLLFSIPCFLFVREERSRVGWSFRLIKDGYSQLFNTLSHARAHANVLRFIGARFLYGNATNTLLVVMAVYATRVLGFSDPDLRTLIIVATLSGIPGAIIYGTLVDRIGPKKTLIVALGQWTLVFIAAAATFHQAAFWGVAVLVGTALAGTSTVDRVFLLRLTPTGQAGEFFGLYGLVGRSAAVVGPMVWGGTLLLLEGLGLVSYRIAILALLVSLLLGFVVVLGVREKAPEPAAA